MHAGLFTLGILAVSGFVATAWSAPSDQPPSLPPDLPATAPSVASVQFVAHDPNRVICHDRIATGSRLAYARDCHTRAEWDMITKEARDYINGQQLRALNAAPPLGG